MEINYDIIYDKRVLAEDVPKLNGAWKKKIKKAIEQKLTTHPRIHGKPLRKSLYGCYRLRVGAYRVIYVIEESSVYVVTVQHRSVVYKNNPELRL